ncbi:MAG: hypothetical protein KA325_02755 [Flavobacterium sp.]|nr:hypothetical protein [Flavobacterium sp.]
MSKKPNPSSYIGFVAAVILVLCSAFAVHKFYMGIYQVTYAPAKKRLQIAMRLFVDDCNTVLYQTYQQKTKLGDPHESPSDMQWMNTYVQSHFKVVLNGKSYPIQFKRKELENNVLVCYYTCEEVPKFNRVVLENTVFTDVFPDQQNMIQAQLFGKKQSALLTQSVVEAVFVNE